MKKKPVSSAERRRRQQQSYQSRDVKFGSDGQGGTVRFDPVRVRGARGFRMVSV